ATDARRKIIASKVRPHDAADLPEDAIASEVPKRVVDLLEVVEVDREHRHRALVPRRAAELAREGVIEGPAVRETGEPVGRHEPVDFFVVGRLDVPAREVLADGAS